MFFFFCRNVQFPLKVFFGLSHQIYPRLDLWFPMIHHQPTEAKTNMTPKHPPPSLRSGGILSLNCQSSHFQRHWSRLSEWRRQPHCPGLPGLSFQYWCCWDSTFCWKSDLTRLLQADCRTLQSAYFNPLPPLHKLHLIIWSLKQDLWFCGGSTQKLLAVAYVSERKSKLVRWRALKSVARKS